MRTDELDRRMATDGRVEIPTSRAKCTGLAALGGAIGALGTAMVRTDPAPTAVVLLGLAVGAVGLAVCLGCLARAVTRRPVLVVDTHGIAIGDRFSPWSDILGVGLVTIRLGVSHVVLRGRPGTAVLVGRTRLGRALGSREVVLPTCLVVRPRRLRRWLEQQRTAGPRSVRRRSGPAGRR